MPHPRECSLLREDYCYDVPAANNQQPSTSMKDTSWLRQDLSHKKKRSGVHLTCTALAYILVFAGSPTPESVPCCPPPVSRAYGPIGSGILIEIAAATNQIRAQICTRGGKPNSPANVSMTPPPPPVVSLLPGLAHSIKASAKLEPSHPVRQLSVLITPGYVHMHA